MIKVWYSKYISQQHSFVIMQRYMIRCANFWLLIPQYTVWQTYQWCRMLWCYYDYNVMGMAENFLLSCCSSSPFPFSSLPPITLPLFCNLFCPLCLLYFFQTKCQCCLGWTHIPDLSFLGPRTLGLKACPTTPNSIIFWAAVIHAVCCWKMSNVNMSHKSNVVLCSI